MKPGIPDMFVLFRGRLIGIELKAKKGTLSDAQDQAQTRLLLAGAVYHVARSVEEARDFLKQIIPLKGRLQ